MILRKYFFRPTKYLFVRSGPSLWWIQSNYLISVDWESVCPRSVTSYGEKHLHIDDKMKISKILVPMRLARFICPIVNLSLPLQIHPCERRGDLPKKGGSRGLTDSFIPKPPVVLISSIATSPQSPRDRANHSSLLLVL